VLRAQDIIVALKLAASDDRPSYSTLSGALSLSPSQAHSAVSRAVRAGLVQQRSLRVNGAAMLELLVHGVKYVFPAERGRVTRGIPTAHAAPPLSSRLAATSELPPVWPDPEGTVRGETFKPLHRAAIAGAKGDPKLYELLALVDALRGGRARDRQLAAAELSERLAP